MKGIYTIIVPSLDRTGPVNVACDLGREAANRGWRVRLLSLSKGSARDDTGFAEEVRPFRLSDLWTLRGVVHTHCLRPDLLGGILALNRNCTLVTTVHNFFLLDVGFGYPRPLVWLAWHLWRRTLPKYDHVVCISNAMRRYYRRILPSQSFALAYNFRAELPMVDDMPGMVSEWIDSQRTQHRHLLVYVGGLSRRKNLAAAINFLRRRPDCALLICGDGPQRSLLERQVCAIDLGERIFFTGQIRNPRQAILNGDMLVLPSFAEGFPLVVLEAASLGVPSLLSNIAVHRELCKLGFGVTFDHRLGSDFPAKVDKILREFPVPDQTLQELWQREYSLSAGFSRYETLFMSSSPVSPQ
ncbi:glycosyltransferase family 4 protein [Pandoraea sp.]|uniref:glycosyltransferase family 4 protein n=1 Tax=Pandoraea sp. TaxID=1883445 RepID=UPI0012235C8E|nr:glycosyltransferase family 4 protein [Pandoraea sp.]TAL55378.1 MAG: glycosyltransferase [Pandoraea sp.]TAM15706.1 MAG: glycosyltransferase [Pandoraea sp.]